MEADEIDQEDLEAAADWIDHNLRPTTANAWKAEMAADLDAWPVLAPYANECAPGFASCIICGHALSDHGERGCGFVICKCRAKLPLVERSLTIRRYNR